LGRGKPANVPDEKQKAKNPPKTFGAQREARRYIPVKIKRDLHPRAEGKCEYQDPKTGRRCNSTHALEIDHVQPQNFRLVCANHNG
jgi:hypothetical protein